METPGGMDEKLWRVEAFEAVLGNDAWTCLTAHIAPDGSELSAVYRMRLTGTRRRVVLASGPATSLDERRAEIRRRLGLAPTDTVEAPAPERETRAAAPRIRYRRARPQPMMKRSNRLRA